MNKENLSKSELNVIYQKAYYVKNRQKMIDYNCTKLDCELCGRKVCRNRILKHYNTNLCKNTQRQNKLIDERKKE